jgi:radical SAM protein with 4Fe4S-binding SPASM domain
VRHTPIQGIVLSDAEMDHTLGLLSLREMHVQRIYATQWVYNALMHWNPFLQTLSTYCSVEWYPMRLHAPTALSNNVRQRPLTWIWEDSPLFNRFRGLEWMPEPCKSCPRRSVDMGGCRCQAFQLTGDAAVTDPVCHISPHHAIVEEAVWEANSGGKGIHELIYRRFDAPT